MMTVEVRQKGPFGFRGMGDPLAPVATAPGEPLLLTPDLIALGAGAIFSSARSVFWGAALLDIIGRQMSTTYRNASYQYVHRYFYG